MTNTQKQTQGDRRYRLVVPNDHPLGRFLNRLPVGVRIILRLGRIELAPKITWGAATIGKTSTLADFLSEMQECNGPIIFIDAKSDTDAAERFVAYLGEQSPKGLIKRAIKRLLPLWSMLRRALPFASIGGEYKPPKIIGTLCGISLVRGQYASMYLADPERFTEGPSVERANDTPAS